MSRNQLNRGRSSLKYLSEVAPRPEKGTTEGLVIHVSADEKFETLWNVFKDVARRRYGGKEKAWLKKALEEAITLYIKRYGIGREHTKKERKKKVRKDVKKVIESFFAAVLSHYKRLQPGLTLSLVYLFLEGVGIESRTTKYRYLKRMCSMGLLTYSGLDVLGQEPVYTIEWENVQEMFPKLFESSTKQSLRISRFLSSEFSPYLIFFLPLSELGKEAPYMLFRFRF